MESIVRAVNDAEVPFIVVGGLAVVAHGYGRQTPRPWEPLTSVTFRGDIRVWRGFAVAVTSLVLEYNQDPTHLRDLLLYKLTLDAQQSVNASALSKREIIRRVGTSATQFYRLLDQTNYRKSVDRVLNMLHVLECDVDVIVREKGTRPAHVNAQG